MTKNINKDSLDAANIKVIEHLGNAAETKRVIRYVVYSVEQASSGRYPECKVVTRVECDNYSTSFSKSVFLEKFNPLVAHFFEEFNSASNLADKLNLVEASPDIKWYVMKLTLGMTSVMSYKNTVHLAAYLANLSITDLEALKLLVNKK